MSKQIVNPMTGKLINRGSIVYQNLKKKGLIKDDSEDEFELEETTPKSKAYNGLAKQVQQQNSGLSREQMELLELLKQQQAQKTQLPKPKVGGTKIKKPPQQKVNDVLDNAVKSYYKTIQQVPEGLDEEQIENFIKLELVKQLKSTNNKYINKYLPEL